MATGTSVTDKTYGYCTGTATGVGAERYGHGMVPSTAVRTYVEW